MGEKQSKLIEASNNGATALEKESTERYAAYLNATCDNNKQVEEFLGKISSAVLAYGEYVTNATDGFAKEVLKVISKAISGYETFMTESQRQIGSVLKYGDDDKISSNRLDLLLGVMNALNRLSETRNDGYKATLKSLNDLQAQHGKNISDMATQLLLASNSIVTSYTKNLTVISSPSGIVSAMQRTLNVSNTDEFKKTVNLSADAQVKVAADATASTVPIVKAEVGATKLKQIPLP